MSAVRTTLAFLIAAVLFGAETIVPGAGNTLVAHEWGTFTSVTEADGGASYWLALSGAADLPCFVNRHPLIAKTSLTARVRMETPVVYFYAHRPTTVSLRVRFPMGVLTEWYPRAGAAPQSLDWENVEVIPNADLDYPAGKGDSHYYAARETDAAALRVGNETEKLLFYRGAGDFKPPASPRFDAAGRLELRGVGRGFLFENRGGKVGWRAVSGPGAVELPELTGDVESLRAALVETLTDAGLYQKEARAMVETWRDSWFEEGLRLLYLLPREFVDRVLPLEISPRPREIARVFVGRAELLSPARREALAHAMDSGDVAGLQGYGRFLSGFARQVIRGSAPRASTDALAAADAAIARRAGSGQCVE